MSSRRIAVLAALYRDGHSRATRRVAALSRAGPRRLCCQRPMAQGGAVRPDESGSARRALRRREHRGGLGEVRPWAELCRYLNITLGSLGELSYTLRLARDRELLSEVGVDAPSKAHAGIRPGPWLAAVPGGEGVRQTRRQHGRTCGLRASPPSPPLSLSRPLPPSPAYILPLMFRLLAALAAFAAPPDTAHLVLVATTDVHGHATEWDYVADRPFPGGLTRAATVIDSLRARYPGRVLVFDAGDLISGDPFADYYARVAPRDPHPVVEALDLAGYDVATPGNHEYDYGVPVFERATSRTTVRFVSGNIRGLPADTLVFPGYVVLRRGEVRVGVSGFTTPGVMVWNGKYLRGRVRVAPIEQSAARIMPGLRRESDVTVLLVHSGMGGESSYDTTGVGPEDVSARLAGLSPKPDVVVVGHSHREIVDTVIDGVHFVQPKPYAQSLAVVHVTLRRRFPGDDWRVDRVRGESVPLANVDAVAARRGAPGSASHRGPRLGVAVARRGPGRHARRARARRADPDHELRARRATKAVRGAALVGVRVQPARGAHRRGHPAARDLRPLSVREHAPGRPALRGAAQGVSGAERALLRQRFTGPSRAQPGGLRLQLRHGGRRDVRYRPPSSRQQPHPEPCGGRTTGDAYRQLHHGDEQLPAIGRRRVHHAARRSGRVRSRTRASAIS